MTRPESESKIVTLPQLQEKLEERRAQGQAVVLTNGAFDILHVGHVRYLRGAAELADVLVVAVNSDESVRRLKGSERPVVPEHERAEIVAALEFVDYVVVFQEDDVRPVIAAIRPDVHAKGSDYTTDTIPERDAVLAYGGKLAVVGDPKKHSTTTVLEKLKGKN